MVKSIAFYLFKLYISQQRVIITTKTDKKMSDSLSIRLQPQTVDAVTKIAEKRLDEGVKDSKARIVAEAVAKLAKEELANG